MYGEKVEGILGTPMVYGEPVELGTKPHFPPIEPIQFWVERVLGLGGKRAESAAEAIAWAIYHRGTKGAAMFKKGFEENKDQVLRILNSISEEIVKRVQMNISI